MDTNTDTENEITARLERVAALRRTRLQWLLNEKYDGHQAKLASDIDMNAGELSQLLRGHRFFGEKKARRLEALLKLTHLWLDGAEVKTPDDQMAEDFRWVYRHANSSGRGMLRATLYAVNDNFLSPEHRLKMPHLALA